MLRLPSLQVEQNRSQLYMPTDDTLHMEEPFYPNKLQQLRDQNISRITTVLPPTHTHRMPLPKYYKLSYNLATNTKIEKHTSKSVLQPWARLYSPHHYCRHSLPSRSNRFSQYYHASTSYSQNKNFRREVISREVLPNSTHQINSRFYINPLSPVTMPVIQECLHSPTETCGFNCWYFWNVGKSPALRRQEIAEARYGRVLVWREVANQTEASSVEKRQALGNWGNSETLADGFGGTETSSSQNVALEPFRQPEVIGMEEQGLDSSMKVEPANELKGEFYGPGPEASDQGIQSNSALDYSAEEVKDLDGETEAGGVGGQVEGPFVEERRETEGLNYKVMASNIGTEGGSLGNEAVEEGDEEWAF